MKTMEGEEANMHLHKVKRKAEEIKMEKMLYE